MKRLTFRARLSLTMATLAVVGGSVLLAVQYLVVVGAFRTGVRSVETGNAGPPGDVPVPGGAATGPAASVTPVPADGNGTVVAVQQNVLTTLLVSSGILLVVFALVAGLVAWWLAGRVTGRVAAITELAREVSSRDLHARLALHGPQDEIQELGDTIDTMLARLEESFRRQERFIANASHELRTPLAAARTALEAPLVQGRFDEDVVPSVRRALEATTRGGVLIDALLDLARVDAGAVRSEPQALDDVVRESCARWQDAAAERRIVFALDLTPVVVAADRTLLGQAADNLVGNAVRYAPAGSTVSVRVGPQGTPGPEPGGVLEVGNDGDVLGPADLDHLVEPFHRGSRSRLSSEPGSGLGLSLVDAIARRHHGRLALAARTGGGLTVTLTIPGPA